MKKRVLLAFSAIVIFLSLFALLQIYILQVNIIPSITGNVNSGSVSIYIEGDVLSITIHSPLNTTYNFNSGSNYTLPLNVSSSFNVSTWWYTLYDLKHNQVVNESIIFSPNTTFTAVRWSNQLTVYANSTSGEQVSSTVVFYVEVPNTSPTLINLTDYIYICEADLLSHRIYSTDPDEDNITFSISPPGIFFIFPTLNASQQEVVSTSLLSGILGKERVGNHSRAISASDGEFVDTKYTNISVIEINNAPSIAEVGAKTVWNIGENATFYKQLEISDVEDVNLGSGNLNVNITFSGDEPLFNISDSGIINFSAIGKNASVYNISICVNDSALSEIHPKIEEYCEQDGLSQTSCIDFSLTITDENRYPIIESWYPINTSFSADGGDNLYFNVSKRDPDGTIPDSYWYVNDVLVSHFIGSSNDSFRYTFSCGLFGNKSITTIVSDGLLNTSLSWNISLSLLDCPVSPTGSSGGGGGGGGLLCSEKWDCTPWNVCQNLESTFRQNPFSSLNYTFLRQECLSNRFFGEACGFQTRECNDVNSCNSTFNKPSGIQVCYYSENPSCSDGIKNCHSGDCEILTDCGGPCEPCATCSDGKKNQGEQGIDCGGPCPSKCEESKSKLPVKTIYVIFIIMFIILIILVLLNIVKIIKTIRDKRYSEGLDWYVLFLGKRNRK